MMRSKPIKIIGFSLLTLAVLTWLLSQFFTVTLTEEVRLVDASGILMHAIYDGATAEEIAKVIQANPQWAREPIYDGWYAVHCAGQAGRPDILRLLLDHGADINARGPLGANVVVSAFDSKDPATLAFVLDHGANPHVRLSDGSTPLQYIREHGTPELRRVLDKRGLPLKSP
ncbi:MAG: ankyrin repeat domain-containing protein [Planctomycetota bacterium]